MFSNEQRLPRFIKVDQCLASPGLDDIAISYASSFDDLWPEETAVHLVDNDGLDLANRHATNGVDASAQTVNFEQIVEIGFAPLGLLPLF